MPPPNNLQRTGNGRGFRFGPQAEKERIEAAAAKAEADRLAARVHVGQANPTSTSSTPPSLLTQAAQSILATRGAKSTYLTYQTDAPFYAEATGRERVVRRDFSKKDIVITSTTIEKNRVHQAEFKFSNGNTKFFNTSKFDSDKSNFPRQYKTMTSTEKEAFWEEQWVEIVVDIGAIQDATDAEAKFPSVIDMMGKLGPELYKCHFIFITLLFSNEPTDEQWITFFGPEPFAERLDPRSPAVDFDGSTTLSFIAELVKKLQNFRAIKKAGIVIRTPKNDEEQISWDQLKHVLPFYKWWFKSWSILAQPSGTTPPGHRALFVDHLAIDLLNSEARKIKELEKAKERAKAREAQDEWVVIKTRISEFGQKKDE